MFKVSSIQLSQAGVSQCTNKEDQNGMTLTDPPNVEEFLEDLYGWSFLSRRDDQPWRDYHNCLENAEMAFSRKRNVDSRLSTILLEKAVIPKVIGCKKSNSF